MRGSSESEDGNWKRWARGWANPNKGCMIKPYETPSLITTAS